MSDSPIAQAVMYLLNEPRYQLVVESLRKIKNNVDLMIYDENVSHIEKEKLIYKSNLIQAFIDLPMDLFKIESVKTMNE